MNNPTRRKGFLVFLLVLVPVLLFIAWSQASFNLRFIKPASAEATLLLLALSAFIFLAFFIFALILLRILLKLYVERRQAQLGSRFKTKMVVAFLSLSLVPVCFLFAFAYGLLNRSIDKWFSIPFDTVRKDANEIARQLEVQAGERALHEAAHLATSDDLARALRLGDTPGLAHLLSRQTASLGLVSAFCYDSRGRLLARAGEPWPDSTEVVAVFPGLVSGSFTSPAGPARVRSGDSEFFLAARPVVDARDNALASIVSVTRLPVNINQAADEIQREAGRYDELARERKAVKRTYLSVLGVLTLLILFVATWLALFVSKQVTVPIQALAEATHEVSKGNLDFQIRAPANDELGSLIRSFNEMSRQLQESRRTIEQSARDLQRANRELEERGNTMETILENIPTGVISFDPQGRITRLNSTAKRMFGQGGAGQPRSLSELFSEDDTRQISRLFRRAERQGVVTRQMEIELSGRRVFVALTLSSIRARQRAVGSVLVLEDLTEVLRAQKAAAWQEVAQRIAHEIKNPLTPIELSAERIHRLVERARLEESSSALVTALKESASLINAEVTTLKTLVDEFSDFARFPSSVPVPSNLNSIVENALNVFDGRLRDIRVHCELSPDLPLVMADPEHMKRAVVNLIDNAAEALEQSLRKEIWVSTALDHEREMVELTVADSGPGIAREAKERLFLPYFSTKRRGTGLGLAIVSRIVAEHSGSIRVEENRPTGAKFVIELPVERPNPGNREDSA